VSETLAAVARRFGMRRVSFPLVRRALRPQAGRLLRLFEASSRARPDVWRARQDERLRRLAAWCWETVPYYRSSFERSGLTPREIDGVADLAKLPILRKVDLKTHGESLLSTATAVDRRDVRHTSGTTGFPVRVVRDRALHAWGQASWWQGLYWSGIHPADPILDIAIPLLHAPSRSQQAWLRLTGSRTVPLADLILRDFAALRNACAGMRPALLSGQPDQLAIFAEVVRSGDVTLGALPRAVLYRSAALPEAMRRSIVRAFGAPIHARYAAYEFVPAIAHACVDGWLHVNAEAYAVEVVSGEEDAPAGPAPRIGRVLVTDLNNFVAPLLRYDLGDLAETAPEGPCPCGRTWPRIGRITGRQVDVAYAREGVRVPQASLERALHFEVPDMGSRIWEYQFRQREVGKADLLIVTRDEALRAQSESLAAGLERRVGGLLDFRVTFTDHIARPPSGKRRLLDGMPDGIETPDG
jgi:phenylacetate-CoA ligase